MVVQIKQKNAKRGIYMSGEKIISVMPGASIFLSIIFSNPLPIDTTKKTLGTTPIIVEKK